MKTIYYIKCNGHPMLGTARGTIEEIQKLRNHLSECHPESGEFTIDETKSWGRNKNEWNDTIMSLGFRHLWLN